MPTSIQSCNLNDAKHKSHITGCLNPLTIYRHEWGTLTDTVIQNVRETEPIEQFRRENVAFAEAIREGKPSPIPPEQMLLTNVIIQGLIDSAARGSEVQVSIPDV